MDNWKFQIEHTASGIFRLRYLGKRGSEELIFKTKSEAEAAIQRIVKPVVYFYDENGKEIK